MKLLKLSALVLSVYFFWSADQASAAISMVNTDQKISAAGAEISIVYAERDRLAVEIIDLGNGQTQVGFYPSSARVIFKISGANMAYRSLESNSWLPAIGNIEVNKFLLEKVSANSAAAVGDVKEKIDQSVKSVSSDGKLLVWSAKTATISKVFAPVSNGDKHLVSPFYLVDTQGVDMVADIYYGQATEFSKSIYYFDQSQQSWQVLPSYHDVEKLFVTADIRNFSQPVILAVFEDYSAEDGIASFYDQSRYGTFGYKNGDFAASRHYHKGTKLKVTRLKTGDSVIIEVNDYGPEAWTGRIIDLDIAAFEKIATRGAGLVYVKVEELK